MSNENTTASKNHAFWSAPTTTVASKVTATIPAFTSEAGEVTPAQNIYEGEADFAALWACEDLAILRSYAFKGVRQVANNAYATAVRDGKAEANSQAEYERFVREALEECAVVRGFGEPKAPGVTAMLKAQLAEQQAAIAALQEAMASGDKTAIKEAMQALAALKS